MKQTTRLLTLPGLFLALLFFARPQARAAADNTYCGLGDIAQFGAKDGHASLPQRCVYTAMPDISHYQTLKVCPSGTCPDGSSTPYKKVGDAVAAATCGTLITVQARDSSNNQLVYPEQGIQLTLDCSASKKWVVVASDRFRDANFPAEGVRISPAFANPAATSLIGRPAYSPGDGTVYMPKLIAQNANASVINFDGGKYWRFIGLEVTSKVGTQEGHLIGVDPHFTGALSADHLVLDRMVIHGGDSLSNGSAPGGGNTLGENWIDVESGIDGGMTTSLAVIDSYLFDFICAGACTDSHALTFGGSIPFSYGYNEGPFKAVNNYLEATGENTMSGGGGTGAGCCAQPLDIEIRRNYRYKPSAIWQISFPDPGSSGNIPNPSYYLANYPNLHTPIVKNLGEFKVGGRILIEGDIFDTNWGGQSDQNGTALEFDPVSQNAHYEMCAASDGGGNIWALNPSACGMDPQKTPSQFSSDILSSYCPPNPDGSDPPGCHITLGAKPGYASSWQTNWVNAAYSSVTVVANNPKYQFQQFSAAQISVCHPGLNPQATDTDVVARFNIFRHVSHGISMTAYKSVCLDEGGILARVSVHDNQIDDLNGWHWNLKKQACCSWGSGIVVANGHDNPATATNTVDIMHNTILPGQGAAFPPVQPQGNPNAGTSGAINLDNSCGGTDGVHLCSAPMQNITIRNNLGAGGIEDHAGTQSDPCAASNQISPASTLLNCLTQGYQGAYPPSWTMSGNALTADDGKPNLGGTVDGAGLPQVNANTDNNGQWPGGNYTPINYEAFQFINLNGANGGDYHLSAGSPYKGKGDDGLDPGANIDQVNSCTSGVVLGNGTPCSNGSGGDQTPPTVAITSPASGVSVSGVVTVSGTAADNVAVAKVEISTDSVRFQTASGTTNWTYSLDTTKIANGSLTITARATDTSGNQTTTTVSVKVANGGTITITQAASANPNLIAGTSTALTVSASDSGYPQSSLIYTWAQSGGSIGGPAQVAFAPNGTNGASSSTASFVAAGSYSFYVTVKDPAGNIAQSTVAVTVNQTATSIAVTPNSATVTASQTQPFAASAVDQFGATLASQPSFTWNASGDGSIDGSGLFTAGSTPGSATVTALATGVKGSASVTVTTSAITITQAAAASPNPVTGTTTNLTVAATDSGYPQSSLIYTWAQSGGSLGGPAPVAFSPNRSNAAQSSTAAFTQAGSYGFYVTVTDPGGAISQSTVTITVNQTLASIALTPNPTNLVVNQAQQFAAAGKDQFGNAMTLSPSWTASGDGSINGSGLFTAGSTAGSATVTASAAGIKGSASVTVAASAVTITQPAAASPNPVTGTTSNLTVAATDNGWPQSSLTYTWAESSGPAPVSFSPNGNNAAQRSTATFTAAGVYVLAVTVADPSGSVAQSTVGVTVNQILSTVTVIPASVTIGVRKTQPFAASGLDQFGQELASQPTFTWAASGGSISQTGLYTAPGAPGAPYQISAAASGAVGTASAIVVDTIPPTVAISLPADGQQVTGVVEIVGTASDDGSVAWVQFKIDGSSFGARITAPPYSVDWNTGMITVLGGTHTITAVAADEAGNQAVSAPVKVFVKPTRITLALAQGLGGHAGGGQMDFTQSQFVIETGDPTFPEQPAVTVSVAMPSGSKTLTLSQVSSGLYSAIVSSSLFNGQDFAQSGTTVSVSVNGLSFAIALNGDSISPAVGGAVAGTDGTSAVSIAAGQISADAQLLLAPLGQQPGSLSKEGFALLGPIQQLSQTSSATLTSAQMLLSFDPSQIPHGLDPKQVRMGWYDPASGAWQAVNEIAVNGSVMSAPINQFGLYAPLAILPSSTPGPRSCYVYPNPAVGVAPTARIFTGQVDDVEVTVFDVAGRQVRSGSASGAPTGIANGDYYYDIPLDAGMASGGYFFAAHAKSGGQVLKCRGKFAIVR